MFDFIRSHQRLMQLVLLVLIVPSFALIGVSGYSSYVSGDQDLVKVGKSAITMQEFENARANQLRQMQSSSPGGFDPAVFDDPQVRHSLLESLIDYRVQTYTVASERFNVSDSSLRRSIAAMPQLQVDGKFSPERYDEALAEAGMSMRDFEQSQRFELALGRVLGPVTQTAELPAKVVGNLAHALTEERTVRVRLYPDSDFIDAAKVSDKDIQAWYDDNKSSFEVPEQASIQYVLLDEHSAMASVPNLSDGDLQRYYDQNQDRFVRAARVNASHIQINVPDGATQQERDDALELATSIAAKAKDDPDSFADLARERSQDAGTASSGGELGWVTQGTWPPELDKVIFGLQEGEVSDPVEASDRYHVFLATKVEPEQVQTLDEVRDTVETEVKRQLGAERFADMATRLTSLVYDHADSLDAVAQALGITTKSATGIGRDGLLSAQDAGPDAAAASSDADILDDVRVRRAVFSPQVLSEGHNSGVIEISPDTMLAVRVSDLKPAYVPELDKVSDRIREQLAAHQAHTAAVKAGQEALAQLQESDADLSDTPDGFSSAKTVSRIAPHDLDKPVLDVALSVGQSAVPAYTGVESAQGFAVVLVEHAGEGETQGPLLDGLSSQLTQAWGQAEQQAVLQDMRTQANVQVLAEAHDAINDTGDSD